MVELLEKIPEYAGMILEVLGGLVLVASVIVRLTPSPSDDQLLGKAEGFIYKILSFLPTLGVNPNTKKLKELAEKLAQK
jgi:hypothetical protein